MVMPIPSNSPISPMVDHQRNDLITPPAAPAVVESLGSIDPRVALRMALPVVNNPTSAKPSSMPLGDQWSRGIEDGSFFEFKASFMKRYYGK